MKRRWEGKRKKKKQKCAQSPLTPPTNNVRTYVYVAENMAILAKPHTIAETTWKWRRGWMSEWATEGVRRDVRELGTGEQAQEQWGWRPSQKKLQNNTWVLDLQKNMDTKLRKKSCGKTIWSQTFVHQIPIKRSSNYPDIKKKCTHRCISPI